MNKKDLVRTVSEKTGFTQKDVMTVVDSVVETIMNSVVNEEINITGFGKFLAVERAGRIMRNPATGEQVTVPSKKSVKFKPAKSFKDLVNS